MSTRSLQILVGRAIISDSFRADILNGRRAELLQEFDLDAEERAAVLAIRADTLAEFAAQIEQLVSSHGTGPSFSRLGEERESGRERARGRGGDWEALLDGLPGPS